MIFFLSIYFIGILATIYHLSRIPKELRTKSKVIEIILLYQIVFSLGVTSLVAFVGLTTLKDYIAEYSGWPSCPFEQQLANVNLSFGILGILAIWLRGLFWVATILGFSIWIIADGIHHLYEYLALGNSAPGNIGVPLYTDLIIPAILLFFLVLYVKAKKELS